MPPRRKIDLLPEALRAWLREELTARGFSGYDALSAALNARLRAAGLRVSISRSALAMFGAEHRTFTRLQAEAAGWAQQWMGENGLEDEARRHSALFEMITTLAFKVMKAAMLRDGEDIDPRDLHFLGRMLKDIMASSRLREGMAAKERARLAAQERMAAAKRVEVATRGAGLRVSISRSALAMFGAEHRTFTRLQAEAAGWAQQWMGENGLEDEARRHSALFEMITTLAFKVMKAAMLRDGEDIDPRDLHFLGRMLKDIMASSRLREGMAAKERARLAAEERRAAAQRVEVATRGAGLSPAVAAAIRAAVEGTPSTLSGASP